MNESERIRLHERVASLETENKAQTEILKRIDENLKDLPSRVCKLEANQKWFGIGLSAGITGLVMGLKTAVFKWLA